MNNKNNSSSKECATTEERLNHVNNEENNELKSKCLCQAIEELRADELESQARRIKKVLALGINPELNDIFNMESRENDPSDDAIMDYVLYEDALSDLEESERALDLYEHILPAIESIHEELGEGGCFDIREHPGDPVQAHDAYHVGFLRDSSEKADLAVSLRDGLIEKYGLSIPELWD